MIRRAVGAVLALLVLVVAGYVALDPSGGAEAPAAGTRVQARDDETGLPLLTLAELPPEARETLERVDRGGPFRYAKDGAVFGNRERLLPARPSGYYREYTVPTLGSQDRGARRLVTGDGTRQVFYTDDHYASFARVRR